MFKVVYLGPLGSFTHQACQLLFDDAQLSYQMSIEDIFSDVACQKADFGVVPIENSIEGMVTHSFDNLMLSDLKICQEVELAIAHHLFAKPDSNESIETIFSHPQAFAQCKRYLKSHYPQAQLVHASSTSRAIEHMLETDKAAAIAGENVTQYHQVKTLAQRIQDNDYNTTRFLVVGQKEVEPSGHDKTSLMLALDDKPGTLVHLLSPFSLLNINLTKIESRPMPDKKWNSVFFVDLVGHIQDESVQVALKVLETIGVSVKHLGSYPIYEDGPCS